MFGFNFRYILIVYGWSSALFMPGILIIIASLSLWAATIVMLRPNQARDTDSNAFTKTFKWMIGLLLRVVLSFAAMFVFVVWIAGARH